MDPKLKKTNKIPKVQPPRNKTIIRTEQRKGFPALLYSNFTSASLVQRVLIIATDVIYVNEAFCSRLNPSKDLDKEGFHLKLKIFALLLPFNVLFVCFLKDRIRKMESLRTCCIWLDVQNC